MRSWMIAYLAGVVAFHLWGTLLPAACNISLLISSIVIFLFLARIRWVSFFLLAIVWSSFYSETIKNDAIESQYEGVDLYATGYVCSVPKRKELATVFELCDVSLRLAAGASDSSNGDSSNGDGSNVATGLRIKLSWYTRDQIDLEGAKELVVRLKRPHGMVNPYGFIYEKWLFRKGISAVGYVRKPTADADSLPTANSCLSRWPGCQITALRIRVSSYLERLSNDIEHVALIKALSIGFRGDIDSNHWATLKSTGTQHLIAISGLHIGLVFGFALGAATMIWRSLKRVVGDAVYSKVYFLKPLSCISFALLCALAYAAMAGFLVSTQRALIMLLVYSLCGLARRRLRPNTRLLFAAAAVLLVDPNAVLDYGFWLSFIAVWALFFAFSITIKAGSKNNILWIKQSALMQWVIFVGLSPALLATGIGLSYTSLIANFVAIPLVGVVTVPLIFAGLIASPFSSWVSVKLLYMADKSLEVLFHFLELFDGFSVLEVEAAPLLLVAPVAIFTLWLLLLPTLRGVKVWLVLVAGFLFWFKSTTSHENVTELVVFDVGQGLSFAAVNGRSALVYDTGPAYRQGSASQRSLIPYLKARGIKHIDAMIISHGDEDHAGGLKDVESEFTIGNLISGQPERLETSNKTKYCKDGEYQSTGWYSVQFLYVPGFLNRPLSANNHSCAVRLELNGISILLMGDIEKKAEKLIVNRYKERLKVDILVAGHHGSKNATSSALLNYADPDVVVFSSGYKNRFHHPHPDVIERVENSGARISNTATDGAVVFRKENDSWLFEKQRELKKAFWLF
ncbi:DNA internalization-related competence protein ComEC/Rec2 [Alkalimarinus coralli]|uniref:DNA internalization-related competence protein ComEC/Rec2 n=1 Tax=Alkalimarinus coralli TaxID=2935863 RepID=UPI00202B5195|nr:DNA internalization-related competence protein ComEC/Rec2 [Alkalimarinus coralli]